MCSDAIVSVRRFEPRFLGDGVAFGEGHLQQCLRQLHALVFLQHLEEADACKMLGILAGGDVGFLSQDVLCHALTGSGVQSGYPLAASWRSALAGALRLEIRSGRVSEHAAERPNEL